MINEPIDMRKTSDMELPYLFYRAATDKERVFINSLADLEACRAKYDYADYLAQTKLDEAGGNEEVRKEALKKNLMQDGLLRLR